jgi:hypothetical protein
MFEFSNILSSHTIRFFFKLIVGVETNWVHSVLRPPIGLLCQPRVIIMMDNLVNDDWQGKPKYSEKACPNVALSTTNPTCCPDSNPGSRDGKPATEMKQRKIFMLDQVLKPHEIVLTTAADLRTTSAASPMLQRVKSQSGI